MPTIEIREIYIPDIYVPEPYLPPVTPSPPKPELTINPPGCSYWHRDIENTGNRNLILDDPNGRFTICDSVFPYFNPIEFTPKNLVITEAAPVTPMDEPEIPKPETQKTDIPDNKKDDITIPPCPSSKDLRIGSFVNEKRLERVKGYKRGDDGVECITLYEDVAFVDQYIPTPSVVVSTAVIATVAATTPIILNLVKPIVKQIIKKLTTKKDKVK